MSSSSSRIIVLRSTDRQDFVIKNPVVQLSSTIKQIIEQDRSKSVIPVPRVNGRTLSMMIGYCKKHTSDNENKEALEAFDEEFVQKLDDLTLTQVSYAAKYLDIKILQELCDVGLRFLLRRSYNLRFAN
ncbi:SKP1-like protein 1B [Tanacetum coccineum]